MWPLLTVALQLAGHSMQVGRFARCTVELVSARHKGDSPTAEIIRDGRPVWIRRVYDDLSAGSAGGNGRFWVLAPGAFLAIFNRRGRAIFNMPFAPRDPSPFLRSPRYVVYGTENFPLRKLHRQEDMKWLLSTKRFYSADLYGNKPARLAALRYLGLPLVLESANLYSLCPANWPAALNGSAMRFRLRRLNLRTGESAQVSFSEPSREGKYLSDHIINGQLQTELKPGRIEIHAGSHGIITVKLPARRRSSPRLHTARLRAAGPMGDAIHS